MGQYYRTPHKSDQKENSVLNYTPVAIVVHIHLHTITMVMEEVTLCVPQVTHTLLALNAMVRDILRQNKVV